MALIASVWGVFEAYTYFKGDQLKRMLGVYWWAIFYVFPLFISLFLSIWVTKSEKLRQFFEWLLKQWRCLVIGAFFITIEFFLYISYGDWRLIGFSSAHLALVILSDWLLHWRTEKVNAIYEFVDFKRNLENWKYEGNWHTIQEGNQTILVVTDSGRGGIAKPCLSWRNYIFEFETKTVNKYSAWIIRAKNLDHYVMLQCRTEEMLLLFRSERNQGKWAWSKEEHIDLPRSIPTNTWFGVRIEVEKDMVTIRLTLDGEDIEVISDVILAPPIAPEKYVQGSVGFRESNKECAHFRNVRVKRI